MPARLPLRYAALAALSVLLATSLLAGCGAQGVTSPRAASATPTSQANHSTALPTPGRDTPEVTNVLITTDSQAYKSGDTIHVTITNHIGTPIFATSGKANCTVVAAQRKTAQGWQTTQIAPCADTDATDIVQIAAGAPPHRRDRHWRLRARCSNRDVPAGAQLLHILHPATDVGIAQWRAAPGQTNCARAIQPADDGLLAGVYLRVARRSGEICSHTESRLHTTLYEVG